MSWIKHPVVLEGFGLRLEPLTDGHTQDLLHAGQDPAIWSFLPIAGHNRETLRAELYNARAQRLAGGHYPFALVDVASGVAFGSTRLFEIYPQHKKLEIGWTWIAPEYWGCGANRCMKLLLLTYCFETLSARRVQLKTRDVNQRSAKAIRSIGATYEGTLRRDRTLPNGEVRDTLVFSIIAEEWPEVKAALEASIQSAPYRRPAMKA